MKRRRDPEEVCRKNIPGDDGMAEKRHRTTFKFVASDQRGSSESFHLFDLPANILFHHILDLAHAYIEMKIEQLLICIQ